MKNVAFQKIDSRDLESIKLLSYWYRNEWSIEEEVTMEKFSSFPDDGLPLHLMMSIKGIPVASGGIHHEVGLLKAEPRFRMYDPWLALVYTLPEFRKRGYGEVLCNELIAIGKKMKLDQIYLFTITAENLYKKLGWEVIERTEYKGSDCAIMSLQL